MTLSGGAHRDLTPPCDTPTSNRRDRDDTTRRSRRCNCSVDRFSGEAARPRCRSGRTLRLDTALKPWHKRDDWLGPSEHRGGHRGPGASISRPSPLSAASPSAYSNPVTSRGALGGSCSRASVSISTAAERLHGSSMTADFRRDSDQEWCRRESRFTRFQVSADSGHLASDAGDSSDLPVGDFLAKCR